MKIEIVTIGDELLLGFTIDTNAAYLARALAAEGVEVVQRATVGDDAATIAAAVHAALHRTGAVITTGGLGPTADDLTKPSIAALFGRGMHLDEPHADWMRERWRRRFGREMPDANLQQATVPDGSRVLRNNHGSAPGVLLEDDGGRWVAMLPGVPREMRGMCDDTIVPLLRDRMRAAGVPPQVVVSRTLRTTGIPESALAGRVAVIAGQFGDVATAYLPGIDGVDLRLTVRGRLAADAQRALAESEAALRTELGADIYGVD
ncbi:MAG: damage-inducible protein CinA, partial [Gemmatimonadaceae bacterium]|nr:damage-inducible protein CinA [Gemmatimonadaceae bacterium]